ncbi:MAG: hypothetical protein V4677_04615 [Bacteroidota bacterium]
MTFFIFLPFILLAITSVISAMENWNHAMAIINRYSTWMSVIIMMYVLYHISERKTKISVTIFGLICASQLATSVYHQKLNTYDWSFYFNRPLAKWFYRNAEKMYYPDPKIFAVRLRPHSDFNPDKSPYIYFYKRKPKKILIHRTKIDDLRNFGLDDAAIQNIKNTTTYNYDWGYVDTENFKTSYTNQKIFEIIRARKIDDAKSRILSSESWKQQIQEKADKWKRTYDEVLLMDALYILNEEEKIDDSI